MARVPIRWDNVNIPRELGDNGDSNYGDNAQGFQNANVDFRAQQKVEDERLTNQAIADEIAGLGPSSNRRVDQVVAQLARINRAEESDRSLQAPIDRQAGIFDNAIKEFTVANQEKVFNLEKDATEADIRGTEADIRESEASIALKEAQGKIANSNFADQQRFAADQEAFANISNDLEVTGSENYLDQFVRPFLDEGEEPSKEDLRKASAAGFDHARSPEGRNEALRLGQERNLSSVAFNAGVFGQRDAATEAAQLEEAAAQRTLDRERESREGKEEFFRQNGDFKFTIMNENGGLETGTEAQIELEKMATLDDAIDFINAGNGRDHQVNANHLKIANKKNKQQRKALDSARRALPNRSMFVSAVQTYFDEDGTLDWKGLNRAMLELGRSGVQKTINLMNEVRAKKGMSLMKVAGTDDDAGGGSTDPGSVAERLRAGTAERRDQTDSVRESNFITGIEDVPTHAELIRDFPRDKARTRLLQLRGLIMEGKKSHIDKPNSASFEDQEKGLQEFDILLEEARGKKQKIDDVASQKSRVQTARQSLTSGS